MASVSTSTTAGDIGSAPIQSTPIQPVVSVGATSGISVKTIVLRAVLVIAALGVLGYAGTLVWHSMHYETTDNAQIESGAMPVLPRVAGYIKTLHITDYMAVKPGDVLLTIDDAEYQIALKQAIADSVQAGADIANSRAQIATARVNLQITIANADVLKIRRDKALKDSKRDDVLYADRSITQKQMDDSKVNYETLARQYDGAIEQVHLSEAQIAVAEAQLKKNEALLLTRTAQVEQARLRLSYTTITAQAHGTLGKKNVEHGQYIQPGQNLFTIITDSTFAVIANFKETQIEHMRIGQDVEIKLDAYPGTVLHGKIQSFSDATGAKFALLPADNATGNFIKITQRIPVKIQILDAEKYRSLLAAGLSAEVDVRVK